MNFLLEALCKKLEGEIATSKANIMVYERNPAGIGEHPDLIEAIEMEVEKLVSAEDKLFAIREHFGHGNEK